jgi:electron-transferring-flavoprotein dehydrogenase
VSERDVLDLDVLIVGGGPAGLAAAIRLASLRRAAGTEISIGVIEKAREAGAHSLSGAVLDVSVLAELEPDFANLGAPVSCRVAREAVYVLTRHRQWRLPVVPPPLRNHGCAVVSLQALVRWMAERAEAAGVDIFAGFSAAETLYDGDRVIGVRTGDRGLDRSGAPTAAFEPGSDIRAKVTIFCDGVRGNLTKQLIARHHLDDGRLPQTYSLGLKELWDVPHGRIAPGDVIHTVGYPLGTREFGGGFIYGLPDSRIAVGLVIGLGYRDPLFDPYAAFQDFKRHPFVAQLLKNATLLRYGAKALPEGGWYSIPRLHVDGGLIAGDAGGFVNSVRLKGIHLAMRTGMLAADTAFAALQANDTSAAMLARYDTSVSDGAVKRELYPVRNVHQAFEHGLFAGAAFAGLSLLTGGAWFRDPLPSKAGHERLRRLPPAHAAGGAAARSSPPPDRQLTFDRPTSVHHSGTKHREDAPSHLLVHDTDICRTRCVVEFGNPCTRYCPAQVYEMVPDGAGGVRLHVNASNCVHCKTCDISDPYQIVDWVPPEGGDGPQYEGM